MSKRINNHKGWPSKNKSNNRVLRRLRHQKKQLHKLTIEKKINKAAKQLFITLRSSIKAAVPKRFNKLH